jgi:hypothetical protein
VDWAHVQHTLSQALLVGGVEERAALEEEDITQEPVKNRIGLLGRLVEGKITWSWKQI